MIIEHQSDAILRMNGEVVSQSFALTFLVTSVGFYLLGYGLLDAFLGGFVGGLGVSVGITIRLYIL